MNLRQKRDLRRLTRQIIQIIFFLWMPALYTSAFSGVRYVIEQIRAGKPIEQNAFLVMLIALCGFTIYLADSSADMPVHLEPWGMECMPYPNGFRKK